MGMTKSKKPQKSKSSRNIDTVFTGTVQITRSGMSFVIIEGQEKDVMVRQQNLNTALDGDVVNVTVIKQAKNQGRMEGVITQIITRKKSEFTGTLQVQANKGFAFLILDKSTFMPDIYIPAGELKDGKTGDKALVRITSWGDKTRKPVGEIVELLDASDTNDLAMKEILIEAGFPLSFPDEVMKELVQIREEITLDDIKERKDFRKTLTFTIDPVDAKDFDDAISIKKMRGGWYEVGVHIADVSHYVLPDTALDKEAYKRATSVYLPDRVLPMLPEKISNELCSLRPHETKLTFSAVFKMNDKGEIKEHWIGRTIIHSDHRFTYEDVQEIIETGEGQYLDEVLLLNKISQTLRAERFKKGAINFSSQEVRFKLDENAKPVGITIKESKESHQLIEELMLLANRTVAEYVQSIRIGTNHSVPFPYRIHDEPDEEKLNVFAAFARKFGHKLDTSNMDKLAASFNEMLQLAKGKPEQHVLETLGIRTMAKAVYTTENIGHYGLGFENYCHFTSPIRRYPDVLVHRVLQECLSHNVHPDKAMESKCRHSSEMERKAMEAERAGNKYKQVEYMQQYIGEEFEGVVSGVAYFGFWVETVDTKCEGLVSIQNMNANDEFQYDEAEYALVGIFTGRKIRIGDKLRVRVVAANLEKRQLDYELAEEGGAPAMPRRKPAAKAAQKERKPKKETKPKKKKETSAARKKSKKN
jgi:ribonuclease R